MFLRQGKGFCIHREMLSECRARSNTDWMKQTAESLSSSLCFTRAPGLVRLFYVGITGLYEHQH